MLFILHVLVKSHILYFEGSLNYVGIHVLWTGSWDLRLRLWEHPIRCSICGYPVGLCIALTYNWTTHLLVFNFSALNGLNKFLIDRGLLHPEVGFQLSACIFFSWTQALGCSLLGCWLLNEQKNGIRIFHCRHAVWSNAPSLINERTFSHLSCCPSDANESSSTFDFFGLYASVIGPRTKCKHVEWMWAWLWHGTVI